MRIMQGRSFILPICRACFKKKYVSGKHILCSKGQKGTMRQKRGFSVGVLYTIIKVKAAAGERLPGRRRNILRTVWRGAL
ncbi:hypothetical protein [Allofournierella massiliensis]|uniref:hypothetical protein n=1 Tax=Allofournierella massiliensis TaxID=1650663 RepID=UPI0039A193DB